MLCEFELIDEDLSRYSNKIESVDLRMFVRHYLTKKLMP